MQSLKIIPLVSLVLIFLAGCGKDNEVQGALSRQATANQASVDDLALLLTEHPEVSAASLQNIKACSQKKKSPAAELSLAVPNELAREQSSADLNPEIAKKAQDLVDKILDEFAFEAQVGAAVKTMGIAINESKEMMKNFKAQAKEMAKGKGFEGPSKFDADIPEKEISCEEIVNNPYLKIPKAEYERVNKANKKLIKEALSGCPALTAGKFLQCTKDFNTLIAMVNDHASCSMESLAELEKSIDQAMDGKFAELSESVKNCMNADFSKCNFKPQAPNRAPQAGNASSLEP